MPCVDTSEYAASLWCTSILEYWEAQMWEHHLLLNTTGRLRLSVSVE